jgi:uncharacterized membrane protein YedE/YeeE
MRRLIDLTLWPALLVFALAGAALILLAVVTVGLFMRARANLDLLVTFGWMGARDGGLLQALGLIGLGIVALAALLTYKICEGELISRYFAWTHQPRDRHR